jgi:hypothetical protein
MHPRRDEQHIARRRVLESLGVQLVRFAGPKEEHWDFFVVVIIVVVVAAAAAAGVSLSLFGPVFLPSASDSCSYPSCRLCLPWFDSSLGARNLLIVRGLPRRRC